MGCGTTTIKYLLFIFNLICALGGLALIIIGSVIQWNINNYGDALGGKVLAPAIILLIVGCVMFVIAFLGCCGAVQESHCMIVTYSVLVSTILIVQVICGILVLVYREEIDAFIKKVMDNQMANYNKPGVEGEIAKQFWDTMQQDLQCCGTNGPADWVTSGTTTPPDSCKCQDPQSKDCLGSYYSQGCYGKFIDLMHTLQTVIGAVAIVIAVIELIAVIFACTLGASYKRKSSYHELV